MLHQLVVAADSSALNKDLRGRFHPFLILEARFLGAAVKGVIAIGDPLLIQQIKGFLAPGTGGLAINLCLFGCGIHDTSKCERVGDLKDNEINQEAQDKCAICTGFGRPKTVC